MSNRSHSSRRAFFLNGGAVLGAGVAAGASALAVGESPSKDSGRDDQLEQLRGELDAAADREAVRQLHFAFTARVEAQDYDAAARLFEDQAHWDDFRQRSVPSLHAAYRPNSRQQQDVVTLSDDRQRATATFHVDARICTPLQGEFTVARMARLQGQMTDSRWETGRLEAHYVKHSPRVWRIASLRYVAS